MPNLDPLKDAYLATNDKGEENLINHFLHCFETGNPFPRDFYESAETGGYCTLYTYRALGQVLKSIDEEERLKKEEGKLKREEDPVPMVVESGSAAPSLADLGSAAPAPADLAAESALGVAVAPKKARSKRPRSPPKVRSTRKAARVALRRMRGLPDHEYIILSSDEDEDMEDASPSAAKEPESGCSEVPVVKCYVRRMNHSVQPSE